MQRTFARPLRLLFPPLLLTPLLLAPLLMVALFPAAARASSIDETPPDQKMLLDLEQRAAIAKPKDQCFLYAELVHKSTELAGLQMIAGDTSQATATLHQVEHYADLIHMNVADDSKRLKNAEILMHHTTLRLTSYVHSASADDRALLASTLKRLDQVQNELLMQVFKH